ncbi:MAG: endo-1,4-beta-xylanase [Candidatus Wildermuthbacteria bacterium]|nr:endo-1,4-beta-xylanase [Candidatus Wildermuthbacteria bacterium]
MKKVFRFLLFGVAAALGIFSVYLFAGSVPQAKEITWGANFSKKHAVALGLDWRATYSALLDDLGVKRLKVSLDWDELAPEKGEFSFADADWQVAESEKRNAQLLLVVGMKTMRWPECHIPEWAQGLLKREQQEEVLKLLEAVVQRYKDSPALYAWQVENEPLFPFGDCPWRDLRFLKKEVALVKALDPNHPVVISDSGELSFWIQAGRIGDKVSTTMYRKVWFHEISRYVEYPLPPVFYARKAAYVRGLFGKEVMVGELQAEPWGPGKLLYDTSLEEQDRAFNLAQFRKNIAYAKRTGLKEFYLWGSEWWFWRKEKASDPTFWEEARALLRE